MQRPASTTPPEADEERDASLRSATSAWWLTGERPDLLGSIEDTSQDLPHDSEGQQAQPTPQSSWSPASSLTPSPSGGALANSTRPMKRVSNPSNAVWSPERSAFEVSGHATGPLTPQESYERVENLNEEDFAIAFAKEKAARPWKTGKGISLTATRAEVAYNGNQAFQSDDMPGPTGRQASAPGTSHGLLAAAPIFEHHRARTQPSAMDSRDAHDWSLANGALEASLEHDSQLQPALDKATARRGLRSLTPPSVTPVRLEELQDVNAALLVELEKVRGQLAEKEAVNIALSRRLTFLEAKLGIRSAEPLSGQQSMSNASTPIAFNPRANSLLHTSYGDPRAEMLRGGASQSVTPDPFSPFQTSQHSVHQPEQELIGEEIKQEVVEELLNDRLMETLTSRNSIHVWQKVLEINWSSAEVRQRMFDAINNVMRGKWAQTARQETGSIVCQNIFESADREEKRECISEILEQLCLCATNQWGVWVVQHILEHGEAQDRRTAFNKLLEEAVHLTLSQYGQKAIMTALKCHDADFINAYLDIICDRESAGEGGASSARSNVGASSNYTGSRRSVLVDIASAPQGTQIMHTLLTSVGHEQRDRIIRTVRKNSVFLKGSKAGLKVHQLVERARAFGGY
ncbi:Translational repressor Pumilio/PUF3 and related RNA-binding proteins (Puf superfamily) [Ceraceosorus bombacis]|uniref:Translational repressor Pumilio/PUF3 and related RNA-binding proteins (Puf superfamily) n=1 Tax=Ceraceosorus bombacis TaxID=401625 RepID=A0A0P1BHA6_9BASI|nr:Translational repressor Pumilio/PUF3 and related RNA-binding proteins (Puf superfamily) [Ceraceosorus bombacis]